MIRRIKLLLNKKTRRAVLRRFKNIFLMRLFDVLSPLPKELEISGRKIGKNYPVFVIAEIGVNHNGSRESARQLIDAAANADADAVKFQKRELTETYQTSVVNQPELHEQSFQYLIPLLKEFELKEDDYRDLCRYAAGKGLIFFASAFDEKSVDFLERVINPPLYKIASCDLTNFPLLEKIITTKKPMILSTGMSTLEEIDETVVFLRKRRARFILLHAQSTYPAASDTLNLAMIRKFKFRYGGIVGYSGHELDIHHSIEAAALGASVIERHITLDRSLPGPDHTASLEPEQFKELVSLIRDFETAYGVPIKRISRGEAANRLTLRKSIVATQEIPIGTKITRTMITAKSPGNGLSPQRMYDIIGMRTKRFFHKDEMFFESDLYSEKQTTTQVLNLGSAWGIKARFGELDALSRFSPTPAFFEFHMSDKDLDYLFDTSKKYPQNLFVHAPEYYGTDLIDLASEDNRIWEQSIQVIQKTIDKTRTIQKSFAGKTPKIIIHVGGMSLTPHPDPKKLFARAKEAFRKLDYRDVEILPENLPPFGWFFSGLWHCNIFGIAEEMIEFCKEFNMRMCLDVSHAWLYTTHHKINYEEYLKKIAPIVGHLHLSDARGSHKEGLQIGEGDVPFARTFEILNECGTPNHSLSWVPEIWQGYLENYKHFRSAFAKLSAYPFLIREQ